MHDRRMVKTILGIDPKNIRKGFSDIDSRHSQIECLFY